MRRVAVAGIALVAIAVGAWFAFGRTEEPWPPDWYIDPATNGAEYAALRRRATASPAANLPPTGAKLELLRNMAVGATLSSDDNRLTDARVYAGYVLVLRGKFSTAGLSRPPGASRRHPAFAPCVKLVLDRSTFHAIGAAIGPCEDMSFMGESIELDLSQEQG